MKRGLIIANLLVAITLVFVLIIQIAPTRLTGNVIFNPPTISSCTEDNVRILWDSIFKEGSSGSTVVINSTSTSKCDNAYAYKVNGNQTHILIALQDSSGRINLQAYYLNVVNDSFKTSITTGVNSGMLNPFLIFFPVIVDMDEMYKKRNLTVSEADTEFRSIFKVTPQSWAILSDANRTIYAFNETDSIQNIVQVATVIANYTTNMFYYLETASDCTPNWTALNTSCISDDSKTQWYRDSNSCNNNTNRPLNQSFNCDFDSNGIIGNVSKVNSTFDVNVYINNSLGNLSKSYSNIQKVEIKSDDQTIIEFNWNFSNPLNFKEIYLEKQLTGSQGYLLIKNLKATKTVWVDKLLSNSTRLCIKNEEINSVSAINSSCEGVNEVSLACPATSAEYTCTIEDDYFKVTGLTNSGIIELNSGNSDCTPNWNCTNWSICLENNQIRSCTDENNCNNISTIPPLNQECIITPPCTPSWNCTSWQPSKCPENETQTRNCIDKNNCGLETNKPSEEKSCTYTPEKNNLIIVIIIVIVIVIIGIIAIIAYLLLKKPPYEPNQTPATQFAYTNQYN